MKFVSGYFTPANVCRKIGQLLSFYFLVGWHASAISLPPGDVIMVKVAYPLNETFVVYIRNN